jgi:hypothetical protein
MLLNESLLNRQSANKIKLAHVLSEISNNFRSDIKLIRSDENILKFCFGIEQLSVFNNDLLLAIKEYCKEKSLILKVKKTKRTSECQIILV